jgi:hypothetical protein
MLPSQPFGWSEQCCALIVVRTIEKPGDSPLSFAFLPAARTQLCESGTVAARKNRNHCVLRALEAYKVCPFFWKL